MKVSIKMGICELLVAPLLAFTLSCGPKNAASTLQVKRVPFASQSPSAVTTPTQTKEGMETATPLMLSIEGLGKGRDDDIGTFGGRTLANDVTTELTERTAVPPIYPIRIDWSGWLAGLIDGRMIVVDETRSRVVMRPFADDEDDSVLWDDSRSPLVGLGVGGGTVGVALESGEALVRYLPDKKWVRLKPPGAEYLALRIYVEGAESAVAWERKVPKDRLFSVYRDGATLLQLSDHPAQHDHILKPGRLEILVHSNSGPRLERVSFQGAVKRDSLPIPFDEAYAVDSTEGMIAVSGRRGDKTCVGLYSHSTWSVLNLEPLRGKLTLATDGERVLVGSPESSRALHGLAYQLSIRPDGTLWAPKEIYSEHSEDRTTLFGRTVLLVPNGPAIVGWRGSSWRQEGGSGPGYRTYDNLRAVGDNSQNDSARYGINTWNVRARTTSPEHWQNKHGLPIRHDLGNECFTLGLAGVPLSPSLFCVDIVNRTGVDGYKLLFSGRLMIIKGHRLVTAFEGPVAAGPMAPVGMRSKYYVKSLFNVSSDGTTLVLSDDPENPCDVARARLKSTPVISTKALAEGQRLNQAVCSQQGTYRWSQDRYRRTK